jgi:hypothetical protein
MESWPKRNMSLMLKPRIIINDNGKQHMADIPWNLDATLIDDAGGPELTGKLAWCLLQSQRLKAPSLAMITFDGKIDGKRTLHAADIEGLIARRDFPAD